MEVLPFKSVREEDAPLIGVDLFNLAKLSWFDFPVASGVVVLPPELKIKTLLEHIQFKDGEVFEQRLELLNSQIRKIPIPEDLEKNLKHHSIDMPKLWQHLLEFWINQLRHKIWAEGFSPNLTSALTAQPVFFTDKISANGFCFFNQDLKMVMFEVEVGEITEKQKEQLEDLVKRADKRLFLPQVYSWVVERGVKLVKLSPLTQVVSETESEIVPEPLVEKAMEQPRVKPVTVSATKVLIQTDNSFRSEKEADGAIICSEAQTDPDAKLLHVTETAQTLAGKVVIFKLFDDPKSPLRGSLNLIHRQNLLQSEAETIKFARNKKHLANVGIGLPLLRSADELVRLKMELSSLGLSRQGNLKLWVELSVPENFLNLEEYLDKGIDGVLINLDELSTRVGGFNPEAEEGIFYAKQVKAVLKLLEPALKQLHKEKIPAIATGSLSIHDDVLDFLVENGIYGISVDFANFLSIHERLRLIEKRVIKLRVKI